MGFGHEGCTALLPVDHKGDLVLQRMKPVQHSQIAFTGHAKRVGHALGYQAFDQ